jgi:myo-inositol-1(or 4)-monophosphatase
VGHGRRRAAGARGGGRYCDLAGRAGLPANGNLIAGNLNVVKAMVDAIGANASPTPLKA